MTGSRLGVAGRFGLLLLRQSGKPHVNTDVPSGCLSIPREIKVHIVTGIGRALLTRQGHPDGCLVVECIGRVAVGEPGRFGRGVAVEAIPGSLLC